MSDPRSDIRLHNDNDRPLPIQSNAPSLPEPKNVQDLTQYVSVVLQQMQDRFQTMSDQILSRNILFNIVI
ncbi:Heat shock factor-binding protein 1 [Armadillidium vulgare]|nr:Heat shock factor-binding protein 1 [Armadillidium vulgare]